MRVWDLMGEDGVSIAERRGDGKGAGGKAQAPAGIDAPMVCPEESPQCARRRKPLPPMGPDAPTPARIGTCRPMGRSIALGGDPKGTGGERKAPSAPAGASPCPRRGLDAPTPARIGTGRPKGRSHFSFGGERKVCKRKPAARRLREKALYCPFWRRGSLCRAQRSWPATPAIVRARSSPFSAVKMGGPFSLRCLSPLCFGAVGVGHTYPLQVGKFQCGWGILRRG